jgi:hypothetical protein
VKVSRDRVAQLHEFENLTMKICAGQNAFEVNESAAEGALKRGARVYERLAKMLPAHAPGLEEKLA